MVVRHVLTRSVRDSAAVLDLLAGPMPGDPYTAPPPARPFLSELRADPRRLRIGLRTTAPAGVASVDPVCVETVEHTAARLESLGHVVEPSSPAALDEGELLAMFMVIASAAVTRDLAWIAAIAGREPTADDVEHLTWNYAETAKGYSATDHTRRDRRGPRLDTPRGAMVDPVRRSARASMSSSPRRSRRGRPSSATSTATTRIRGTRWPRRPRTRRSPFRST